jgi:hypothetical protein
MFFLMQLFDVSFHRKQFNFRLKQDFLLSISLKTKSNVYWHGFLGEFFVDFVSAEVAFGRCRKLCGWRREG